MEYAEVMEGLNEWEQIQPPSSSTTTATATVAQWVDDGDIVVIRDNLSSDSSNFPPANHEGLPITSQHNIQHFQEPLPSSFGEADGEGPVGVVGSEVGRRLRARLGLLSSGIIRVAYRIRGCDVGGIGFWSIASATAGVVAVVVSLYMRVRRRRRRVQREDKVNLMNLIREKDQKINQLLFQIAQMDEILSARRRVPVVRVG